ncbi:carbohydrate-binding module family 1 protein [Botryobasidium botryosum FD-172 SS1]|uniref:Carbohydrate-binding module family 1 protein n=1 Tax=Botryobasidium botryosum (strain FD-172 SS1) TaxID=930990 RepID=A0A067M2Z0_BOTB1|nr:carbohydrate-binding module family 1 protein [Botryobasidium botryosum FD-172 SS1]
MKAFGAFAALSVLSGFVQAGTVIWDGSFDPYNSAADFDKWTWANQVGAYQWYIHGTQPTSRYLATGASYKNPAVTREKQGLKLTIDSTAHWNSDMERSELIPQTTANLGSGRLFYHFSVKRSTTNAPDPSFEHQVLFFESHFTELKYGVGNTKTDLQWFVSGSSKWSTPFQADVWYGVKLNHRYRYNFAYDINFSGNTVSLWASTGGNPLVQVVQPVGTSTFTNSADFHVGVLRLGTTTPPEDWYISRVFIESGSINTAIGSGTGTTQPPTTTLPTTTAPGSTSKPVTTTTASQSPLQTQYGQCGGNGWTGPSGCVSPFKCVEVSPPWYSQCQ